MEETSDNSDLQLPPDIEDMLTVGTISYEEVDGDFVSTTATTGGLSTNEPASASPAAETKRREGEDLETFKRRRNAIHSRRKRQRKKVFEDDLHASLAKASDVNKRLKSVNALYTSLLDDAHRIIKQIDPTSGLERSFIEATVKASAEDQKLPPRPKQLPPSSSTPGLPNPRLHATRIATSTQKDVNLGTLPASDVSPVLGQLKLPSQVAHCHQQRSDGSHPFSGDGKEEEKQAVTSYAESQQGIQVPDGLSLPRAQLQETAIAPEQTAWTSGFDHLPTSLVEPNLRLQETAITPQQAIGTLDSNHLPTSSVQPHPQVQETTIPSQQTAKTPVLGQLQTSSIQPALFQTQNNTLLQANISQLPQSLLQAATEQIISPVAAASSIWNAQALSGHDHLQSVATGRGHVPLPAIQALPNQILGPVHLTNILQDAQPSTGLAPLQHPNANIHILQSQMLASNNQLLRSHDEQGLPTINFQASLPLGASYRNVIPHRQAIHGSQVPNDRVVSVTAGTPYRNDQTSFPGGIGSQNLSGQLPQAANRQVPYRFVQASPDGVVGPTTGVSLGFNQVASDQVPLLLGHYQQLHAGNRQVQPLPLHQASLNQVVGPIPSSILLGNVQAPSLQTSVLLGQNNPGFQTLNMSAQPTMAVIPGLLSSLSQGPVHMVGNAYPAVDQASGAPRASATTESTQRVSRRKKKTRDMDQPSR